MLLIVRQMNAKELVVPAHLTMFSQPVRLVCILKVKNGAICVIMQSNFLAIDRLIDGSRFNQTIRFQGNHFGMKKKTIFFSVRAR